MSALEYIEKAWEAYKKNFWPIVIALILQFVIVFIPFAIGLMPWAIIVLSRGLELTELGITSLIFSNLGVFLFSLVMFSIGLLASLVLNGGFIKMLYEALRGKTKYETMLKTAKEKMWPIIGANLFVLLILLFLIAIFFAPLTILINSIPLLYSPALSFLYTVFVVLVAIAGLTFLLIASVLFIFVNQAVVIDNLKAAEAIRRSFDLSRKNFLSVFFILAIFIIFSSGLENILSTLGTIINIFVTTPLLMLSLTAFFVDKRKKKK